MILWTGQQWVDPVMSLAVAVVILWGSIGLLKESVWMSLAGVPAGHRRSTRSRPALAELDGVEAVHDLHVWPLSTTETALTAHIVAARADDPDELLASARAGAARHASGSSIARCRSSAITLPTTRIAEQVNVTHLECSLTGERYEAGQVHNLSRAGKPLLVRYDIEAAKRDADPREHRRARAGHVEMARAAAAHDGRAGQPRRERRRRSCR